MSTSWTDPRYRDLAAAWATTRSEPRTGRRPRRTCPHGNGVTLVVDEQTRAPRNLNCAEC
jgi:hypothetical protein